jgi:hypothetical protein
VGKDLICIERGLELAAGLRWLFDSANCRRPALGSRRIVLGKSFGFALGCSSFN